MKQRVKIQQSCVTKVLSYSSETWELTIVDELRLCGVEQHIIRAMCEVKLVDKVSSDILGERVGVAVKYMAVCNDMVMSSVEALIHKYVKQQNWRLKGSGKKVLQGNRRKNELKMIWCQDLVHDEVEVGLKFLILRVIAPAVLL